MVMVIPLSNYDSAYSQSDNTASTDTYLRFHCHGTPSQLLDCQLLRAERLLSVRETPRHIYLSSHLPGGLAHVSV